MATTHITLAFCNCISKWQNLTTKYHLVVLSATATGTICVNAWGGGKGYFCAGGSEGDLLVDVDIIGHARGSTYLK